MTFTVGLTGGIGCGKSSAARLFAERGATLVDTDVIAHELTGPGSPVLSAILEQFGKEVLQSDGALNRAELRRKVFADAQARKKLEALLHPLIRAKALQQLASRNAPYAILVVPLLLETGSLREQVQRVLVVDCSEAQQIARAMARSDLSEVEVRAIMKTQLSRTARLKLGDDVLANDGGLAELGERVEALHRHYLELADAHRARAAAAD
ncbi:MAG TPA: dephospho-CoA kinase [Burkholderiales bacterium]|nr:dephospho-CoA kinase [Burkholderiales bacterium]